MSFSLEDIQQLITRRSDLKRKIKEINYLYRKDENKVLLDYSRRKFTISNKVGGKDRLGKSKQRSDFIRELF